MIFCSYNGDHRKQKEQKHTFPKRRHTDLPEKRRGENAEEMRARIRTAGKGNLSRAVSELMNAGLLRRHYQGYRVDHRNRGGQRHAVYTLIGDALRLVPGISSTPNLPVQGELALDRKSTRLNSSH